MRLSGVIVSAVLCAAAASVSGCATEARSTGVTWRKAGADRQAVRLEYGLCGGEFDAFGSPRFAPSEFAAIDACMRAKGFTRVDA